MCIGIEIYPHLCRVERTLTDSTMTKRTHTLIAELYGMDSRDVYEMRHHYGQTKKPIYVIGDDYFAAGKAKPTDSYGMGWIADGVVDGVTIWKSTC